MEGEKNQILSLSEASKITGYHQDYLGQLCRSGKLRGQKIGRNWTTTRGALEELQRAELSNPVVASTSPRQTVPVHIVKLEKDEEVYDDEEPDRLPRLLSHFERHVIFFESEDEALVATTLQYRAVATSAHHSNKVMGVVGLPITLRVLSIGVPPQGNLTQVKARVQELHAADSIEALNHEVSRLKHAMETRPVVEPLLAVEATPVGSISSAHIQKLYDSFIVPVRRWPSVLFGGFTVAAVALMLAAVFVPGLRTPVFGASKTRFISYHQPEPVSNFANALPSSFASPLAGQVLAAQSKLKTSSAPKPVVLDERYIESLIMNNLVRAEQLGFFRGQKGEKGDAGTPGQSGGGSNPPYVPVYYIPPSPGFTGGSNVGVTFLSADEFVTRLAKVNETLTTKDLVITGTATLSGTINASGTFNPGFTAGSVTFQGAAGLTQDNSNFFYDATNHRLGLGTNTPTATLDITGAANVNGNMTVVGNLDVGGSTTTIGQLVSTRIPTLAHAFTTWPAGTSNASDATIYIHPASAAADTNLIAMAVGGSTRFVVDAEGDVYANNLILAGSTTTGATNIAGNLTVQDNSSLGDAPTDILRVSGKAAINLPSPTALSGDLDIRQITNGDTTIYARRVTDSSPSGNFITYQNAAAATLFQVNNAGAVGVGAATIDASAILQADSTTKGFLPPRLTTAQKNAIVSPATGLTVFDTDLQKLNVFNGTVWKNVGSAEMAGEVTGGTAGSVLFINPSGILAQDNSNFFYDATNHRLGIGTASPSNKLQVSGDYARIDSGILFSSDTNNAFLPSGNDHIITSYGDQNFYIRNRNISTSQSAIVFDHVDSAGNNAYPGAVIKTLFSGIGSGVLTGQLTFSTNNNSGAATERMRIDNNGNVGIGTTATTNGRLSVIAANDNDFTTGLYIRAGTTGGGTGTAISVFDPVGTTNLFRVTYNGVQMGNGQWIFGNSGNSATVIAGNSGAGFDFNLNAGGGHFMNSGSDILLQATNNLLFGAGNTERVRLTSGGDVQLNRASGGPTTGVTYINYDASRTKGVVEIDNTANGQLRIKADGANAQNFTFTPRNLTNGEQAINTSNNIWFDHALKAVDSFALGASQYSADLILRRNGAANLALGNADAAVPVAQIISVQNVLTGTSNTAGANFTINGSQSTGNASGGSIVFQTSPAGGSGTGQNALAAAMTIAGDGSVSLPAPTAANPSSGSLRIANDTSGQLRPGILSTGNGTSLATYGNGGSGNTGSTFQRNAVIQNLVVGLDGSSISSSNFLGNSTINLFSSGTIGWSPSVGSANDVALARTAAGVLKVTDGSTGYGQLLMGKNSVGTTSTDGLVLANDTAATVGAQQYSPRLRFTGQGWKTNATAGSQPVDWIFENQPVQGASAPSANLVISSQINGGGYTSRLTLTSAGQLLFPDVSGTPIAAITGTTNTAGGIAFDNGGNPLILSGGVGAGTQMMRFNQNTGVPQVRDGLGFQSSVLTQNVPTAFLTLAGPANLRLGAADANPAVAQTLSVQNVATGTTDTAGANFTIAGSRGTGTGTGGSIVFQTAPAAGSTGSAQNSLSTAMTILSSGKVGIGTTTPGSSLTIAGTPLQFGTGGILLGLINNVTAYNASPTATVDFAANYTSGGSIFDFGQITVGKENTTSGDTAGYMVLATSSSAGALAERVRIDSNGNMGIGASPGSGVKLDIQSGSTGDLLARVFNSNTSGTGTANFRIANSGNETEGARLQFTDNNYFNGTITGDRTQGLTFRTGTTQSTESGLSDRMVILPAGNVGIGTTNPTASALVIGDGTAGTQRGITINGGSGNSYNGLALQTTGTEKWFVGRNGTGGNDDFIFRASAATNVMTIVNAGAVANSLYISAGNVGIGTTSPSNVLQLGSVFALNQDANSGYIGANFSGPFSGNYIKSQYAVQLHFDSALGDFIFKNAPSGTAGNPITYTSVMTIKNSGNVGIGTINPAVKLQVGGGDIAVQNTASIYSYAGLPGATDSEYLRVYHNASNGAIIDSNKTGAGTARSIHIQVGGSTKLYVQNDGNVGIGTTSPGSKLFITDSAADTLLTVQGTGGREGRLVVDSSATTNAWTYYQQAGSLKAAFGYRNAQGATIFVNGSDRVVVDNNGNVGIGTTSPASALHIYNAAGSTLTLGGVADNNVKIDLDNSTNGSSVRLRIAYIGGGDSRISAPYNSINYMRLYGATGNIDFEGGSTFTFGKIGAGGTPGTGAVIAAAGTSGTPNNLAGGNLTFQSGFGTGNATPGDIIFQTADVQVSGTTVQPLTTKVTIKASGNVGIGTSNPGSKLDIADSLTGSSAVSTLNVTPVWNTSGTPTAIKLNVADTASNNNSLLMDLQVGSTSMFKVRKNGDVTLGTGGTLGADSIVGGNVYFQTQLASYSTGSSIRSPANGVFSLFNNGATDFDRLQFGGTTSSFPALKRSSTELQVRLADDSAFGDLQANQVKAASYIQNNDGLGFTVNNSGGTLAGRIGRDAGTGGLTVTADAGALNLSAGGSAGNVVLQTSNTNTDIVLTPNRYTYFSTGNVGIGTPTPSALLSLEKDAIGTTSTDGLLLQNATAATVSVSQYSPRIRLTGQGWKTNSTAGSQSSDFIIENEPSNGGANPVGNLVFRSQANGGGYTTNATLDSSGNFTPVGNIQMTSNKLQGGTGSGWGSLAFGNGGPGGQTLTISGFNDGFFLPNTLRYNEWDAATGGGKVIMGNGAGPNDIPAIQLQGSQGNDPGNPVVRVWDTSAYASHRVFGVGSGTTYTEWFTVLSSGNVGIGTSTPVAKLEVAPTAVASTPRTYLKVTTAADTNLTASTENIAIDFNTAATRQFATGALTTQRETVFRAPTYSFVGASTITNAATVDITGAPVAGTNATITNPFALRVESGDVQLATNSRLYFGPSGNDKPFLEAFSDSGTGSIRVSQAQGQGMANFVVNSLSVSQTPKTWLTNGTVRTVSNGLIGWSSSSSDARNNGFDAALGRNAAGIVEVNNGNAGTFADLRFRAATFGANTSAAAWGTAGIALQGTAATYTDTSSSGTVTNADINTFAQPTLAASSSTTYTNAATLYVANAPAAGTNVAITNPYAFQVAAGKTYLGGAVQLATITGSTQCLQVDTNGNVSGTACGGGGVRLDQILAATGSNTINNADNPQTWQWDTLSSNSGLTLSSTSTAAASNTQTLLNITLSGANSTTTQTTYGAKFSNTHTGTSSSNVAAYFTASGGSNNYAALFDQGNVGVGTLTPTTFKLQAAGNIGPDADNTYTLGDATHKFLTADISTVRFSGSSYQITGSSGSGTVTLTGAGNAYIFGNAFTIPVTTVNLLADTISSAITIRTQDHGGNAGVGAPIIIKVGQSSTASTGAAGSDLTLTAGAAGGSGNNNGGNVVIDGGAAVNSGTNGNVVLAGTRGNVGIGVTAPANALEVRSTTTPQIRIAYDPSNYFTTAVSSSGAVTFDATGSSASFVFSDSISRPGSGTGSELFGAGATVGATDGGNNTLLGNAAAVGSTGFSNVVVGQAASSGANQGNVVIGKSAAITNGDGFSVVIGQGATNAATGNNNIVIGRSAALNTSTGAASSLTVVIGASASACTTSACNSDVVIGSSASIGAGASNGVTIGASAGGANAGITLGASATGAAASFVAGSSTAPMTDVYFGKGVTNASPTAYTINGTGGTGSNIAGGALQFAGGIATGNAAGGDIIFKTSDAGGSGSSAQSLTAKMTIKTSGNIGIGNSSPAALLDVGKAMSATPSATVGAFIAQSAYTFTDNNTATSGTATAMVFNSIAAPTLAATNSTVTTTNAYGLYLGGAPIRGSNETLTSTTALYVASANVQPAGTVTNSYGLQVNAQTGASNNYAAIFQGGPVVVAGSAANGDNVTQDTSLNLLTVRKDTTSTSAGFVKIELNNPDTRSGAGTNIRYYVGSTVAAGTLFDNNLNKFIIRAQKDSNSFMTFETGGTNERVRIDNSGNFLIGTTTTGTKLTVNGTASASNAVLATGSLANAPATGSCASQTNSSSQAVFQTSTTVTLGHIFYNSTQGKHSRINSSTTCTDGGSLVWQIIGLQDPITGNASGNAYTAYNPAGDIGTASAGFFNNIYGINGQFVTATTSGGFDVAEEYQTTDTTMRAGDVVVLDPDHATSILKSTKAYENGLLGVVSTNPGLTLGNEKVGTWKKVALAGRVPVNVTDENGAIQPGDSLTASATKPGYAMKATVSGQVIGKALEAFPNAGSISVNGTASGQIMIFVSLEHYIPRVADFLQQSSTGQAQSQVTADLASLNITDGSLFGDIVIQGSAYVQKDLMVKGAIYAATMEADTITAKQKLCVGQTCVTEDQLKAVLQLIGTPPANAPQTPAPAPAPEPQVAGDATPTPPAAPAPEAPPETVP